MRRVGVGSHNGPPSTNFWGNISSSQGLPSKYKKWCKFILTFSKQLKELHRRHIKRVTPEVFLKQLNRSRTIFAGNCKVLHETTRSKLNKAERLTCEYLQRQLDLAPLLPCN